MQFLKILFWCLLAFVAALFTFGNWVSVPIRLWGGLVAETNLPFLLLVTFLAGLIPTYAWQQATRWRLRGRLAAAERTVAELRAANTPLPAVVEPTPPVTTP
jgi:putative membrane protein